MNILDMMPWIIVAINIILLSIVFGMIIQDIFCSGYGLPKSKIAVKMPSVTSPRDNKIDLYKEE